MHCESAGNQNIKSLTFGVFFKIKDLIDLAAMFRTCTTRYTLWELSPNVRGGKRLAV